MLNVIDDCADEGLASFLTRPYPGSILAGRLTFNPNSGSIEVQKQPGP